MIRKFGWALVVLVMAGLGIMLGTGLAQVRATSSDLDRAWSEIGELRGAVTQANDRLETQGAPPVAVPDVVTEDPAGWLQGEQGIPGRPGADSFVPGPIGVTGLTGLIGATGATGADGLSVNGDTGDTGATGDTGTKGDTGEPGADAPPPVSLVSVVCAEDGSWVITLTDGATSTTPGPCHVIPAAETPVP